ALAGAEESDVVEKRGAGRSPTLTAQQYQMVPIQIREVETIPRTRQCAALEPGHARPSSPCRRCQAKANRRSETAGASRVQDQADGRASGDGLPPNCASGRRPARLL